MLPIPTCSHPCLDTDMSLDQLIIFATVTLFVSASPGPVMLSTLANGGLYGVRHAAWGMAGATLGNLILIALSFAGLALVLKSSDALFIFLQWAGAAYLMWLGVQMYRQPASNNPQQRDATLLANAKSLFFKSVGIALSNPKGLIYFGAFFPQFISHENSLAKQLLLMVSVFIAIDLIWMTIYARGGRFIVSGLHSPQQRQIFNRVAGIALMGAGILMVAL